MKLFCFRSIFITRRVLLSLIHLTAGKYNKSVSFYCYTLFCFFFFSFPLDLYCFDPYPTNGHISKIIYLTDLASQILGLASFVSRKGARQLLVVFGLMLKFEFGSQKTNIGLTKPTSNGWHLTIHKKGFNNTIVPNKAHTKFHGS